MRFPSKLHLFLAGISVIAVTFGCRGTFLAGGGGGGRGGGATAWVGASASGTSAGSQNWDLTISHSANTFSANNNTASKSYSGSISVPPSLFLENVTTASTDSTLPPLPVTGHSIEVPDTFVVLHINDASTTDVVPLVNTQGMCPTLSGATSLNDIRYGWTSGFDSTTDKAYSVTSVTQSGSSYTATETGFKLDGTSLGATAPETVNCTNGAFSGGTGGNPAFSPTALIGISPPGGASTHADVLYPAGGGAVAIATLVAGQYTAFIFKDNPGSLALGGFGPGSGSSISGGTFANIKTDAFNTHATDITINFVAGPSNGLLTGSVVDVNGTHTPMIAAVAQVNGKFQIFLLTTDTSSTNPYHIYLSQQ